MHLHTLFAHLTYNITNQNKCQAILLDTCKVLFFLSFSVFIVVLIIVLTVVVLLVIRLFGL